MIGHESLGEVVEVGAKVTRVKVGDLVVPCAVGPCPHDHCTACRSSRQDFCFTSVPYSKTQISRSVPDRPVSIMRA